MIRIQVPATSANIGSGFDSLGLALNLYNYVNMEQSDRIEISSLDGTQVPQDESNLIYKSAKYFYSLCGKECGGMKIEQENNIPMTRGLGSSSACIVAGLVGANEMLGRPFSTDELVDLAANLEGHPDNSTPAILGGLVTAVIEGGKVYKVKQEIKGHIKFAAFIPDFELKTKVARESLPRTIDHSDAVYNLSRAALMSVSLYAGEFKNLKVACQDKLHQQYRLKFIRGANQVFDMADYLGAYASYISGAGSTLISIIDAEQEAQFCGRARAGLCALGLESWELRMLEIDNEGVKVL